MNPLWPQIVNRMKISATLNNKLNLHRVTVETNGASKQISIASKADGFGSSVNGGELLLLSLATCFCNDIYREANKRKIPIESVDVIVTGDFGGEGEPGSNFQYKADVKSTASSEEIDDLIKYVNDIAEIHKTLRNGIDVRLV